VGRYFQTLDFCSIYGWRARNHGGFLAKPENMGDDILAKTWTGELSIKKVSYVLLCQTLSLYIAN